MKSSNLKLISIIGLGLALTVVFINCSGTKSLSSLGTDSGNPSVPAILPPESNGTDTGNPVSAPANTDTSFLSEQICNKLQSCFSRKPDQCKSVVLAANNIVSVIGGNATINPELYSLQTAVNSRQSVINANRLSLCAQQLQNTSCNDPAVQSAYDINRMNDTSRIYLMIPNTNECHTIVQ